MMRPLHNTRLQTIVSWQFVRWEWHTKFYENESHVMFYEDLQASEYRYNQHGYVILALLSSSSSLSMYYVSLGNKRYSSEKASVNPDRVPSVF